MKKRNLKSLILKKVTVSSFTIVGSLSPSNACPSAVSCESVCFCIPEGLTDECNVAAPRDSVLCETPSDQSPANGNHANAAG